MKFSSFKKIKINCKTIFKIVLGGKAIWVELDASIIDRKFGIASGTPNWTSDKHGDAIRGNSDAKSWWNTYDTEGNPVINLFEDLCFDIMLDTEGADNGTFDRAAKTIEENKSKINLWSMRSKGFIQDEREQALISEGDEGGTQVIDPKGFPVETAKSYHVQTAFGEDEYWICAVNSVQGIIVSYCDAKWKYVRFEQPPPTIAIPGIIENFNKIADTAEIGQALPGGMAGSPTLGSISTALAAEITLAGKGGENSIWSWVFLKRINEGCFHKTSIPAVLGSFKLATTKIPNDYLDERAEPTHFSALNTRLLKINSWYRYDNWHNTMNILSTSFGANATWFFVSNAMQWGSTMVYLDTPIDSTWLTPPNWRAAVWGMFGIGSSITTARRDLPLHKTYTMSCKHSRNIVCQLYVVQRTSLTLWVENEDDLFIQQKLGLGCYDGLSPNMVDYAIMPDGSRKRYDLLSPEEIESVLSDRRIIRTPCAGEDEEIGISGAFELNRNEIVVMGAVDFYGKLFDEHGRRSPVDQERNPEFEKMVDGLLTKVFEDAETSFDEIYIDMEIL